MLKKASTTLLIFFLMNLGIVSTFAETRAEKEAKFALEVKASVTKLGTGKEAKVQVKLKDGTKIKGYISEINENSFVVVDEKTGTSTEIPYPSAKQVKGNNLSNGVKLAIAIGIIAAVTTILILAGRSD